MNVLRQSVGYSIVGYLGFLIGVLSNFFLFTHDLAFYGRLRFIFSVAQLFMPIVAFGLPFAVVKFFPMADKKGKRHNLLSLALLGVLFMFLVTSVIFLVCCNWQTTQLWKLRWVILPLILIISLSAVWNKYISNYGKVVISNIFENLFPKLANIVAFALFFFVGISYSWSYVVYLSFFIVALIGYICYAYTLDKFHFDFSFWFWSENNRWKQVNDFCVFVSVGNISNLLLLHIGTFITGEFVGFQANGVYTMLFSVVTLVSVPAMGLYTLFTPLINRYLNDSDIASLELYYKKTSLLLFIVGMTLFSVLYVVFPYMLEYFPSSAEVLKTFYPMLLIFGANLLFELATGFNTQIISMSKYYKWGTYFSIISAAICLGLNYIFFRYLHWGIWGIALSYSIANICFNLMKVIFNRKVFGVHPFSLGMIKGIALGFFAFGVCFFVPEMSYAFLNLIVRVFIVLTIILLGNTMFGIYPLKQIYHDFKRK